MLAFFMTQTRVLKTKTKTFFKTKDMRARVEKIECICSFKCVRIIPGVMIEQGMLEKKGHGEIDHPWERGCYLSLYPKRDHTNFPFKPWLCYTNLTRGIEVETKVND